MFNNIGSSAGPSRVGSSVDTLSRVAMLQSQIKGLMKKLQALRKALMESTNPEERKQLQQQIRDLEDMIHQYQAQIAALQEQERRRKVHREQARQDGVQRGSDQLD